jgi:hypothetical protein
MTGDFVFGFACGVGFMVSLAFVAGLVGRFLAFGSDAGPSSRV